GGSHGGGGRRGARTPGRERAVHLDVVGQDGARVLAPRDGVDGRRQHRRGGADGVLPLRRRPRQLFRRPQGARPGRVRVLHRQESHDHAVAVSRARLAAALALLISARASGQVLSTAETLGKGKSAVLLTDNVIVPGAGIDNLNIAYGEYARGLHDRFDLYLSAGATTTEGSTQAWIGGGGNLRLARIRRIAVSLFGVASVPLTHRDQACDVLLNPAVIVSAPIGAKLSIYSGVNSLVPIGDRARGVFTPPSAKVNAPIGATYALGAWGLWGEADFGTLRAFGIGVTRVF